MLYVPVIKSLVPGYVYGIIMLIMFTRASHIGVIGWGGREPQNGRENTRHVVTLLYFYMDLLVQ